MTVVRLLCVTSEIDVCDCVVRLLCVTSEIAVCD